MNELYRKFIVYVSNTGGHATPADFIEDWEPIGGQVLEDLGDMGLINKNEQGKLVLTQKGVDVLNEEIS